MRVAVIVLSTGPSHAIHHHNESVQRDTFAHDLADEIKFVFVRGGERLRVVRFDDVERVLRVPLSESHENILAKTILALDWVIREWSPDLVLRTNTSSYFHLPLFREEARRLPLSGCYAGVVGRAEGGSFASGAGMWLSPDVAERVCDIDNARFGGLNDDVAIGLWLADRGIRPRPMPRNDVGLADPLLPCYHSRCKGSRSAGAGDVMRELHAVYSAPDSDGLKSSIRSLKKHQRRLLLKEGSYRRFAGESIRWRMSLRESERLFGDVLFPSPPPVGIRGGAA